MEIALIIAGFFRQTSKREIGGDRAFGQVRVQHTEERFYSVFSLVAEWLGCLEGLILPGEASLK